MQCSAFGLVFVQDALRQATRLLKLPAPVTHRLLAPNMNQHALQTGLAQLLRTEGVRACALVDSASGLVWHAAGEVHEPALWEAAMDYWRMYGRLRQHFDAVLGPLGAAVMHHQQGVLALLPCGRQEGRQAGHDGLVVVCVASHRGVNWAGWQQEVRALASSLGID